MSLDMQYNPKHTDMTIHRERSEDRSRAIAMTSALLMFNLHWVTDDLVSLPAQRKFLTHPTCPEPVPLRACGEALNPNCGITALKSKYGDSLPCPNVVWPNAKPVAGGSAVAMPVNPLVASGIEWQRGAMP